MALDPKRVEGYIKSTLKKANEDPESLSKHELRLANKYNTAQERVGKIQSDMQTLKSQLEQGEARMRSMELQVQSEGGKANAFLEALVALEFDEDLTAAPPAKGNGSEDPAPKKPKEQTKQAAQASA